MAKFTDAVKAVKKGYFDAGDQPTEAQFDALIDAIQEGIEEHQHDGTGDGDGTGNLGSPVGIGLARTEGTLHVHTASAGAVTADATGDDLVVENNASGGISILVPDVSDGNILFGTPSDSVGALIRWTYLTPRLLMGTATAGGTVVLCSANAVTGIHISATQQVGIACVPNSRFEINLATKNLEIVNAGSVGATEQDWVEVEIGGVQGYLRVYAAK